MPFFITRPRGATVGVNAFCGELRCEIGWIQMPERTIGLSKKYAREDRKLISTVSNADEMQSLSSLSFW